MAQTRPYKSNVSELQNADVLSLFRKTTCSASASIHYNTLKVHKIYSYSDSRKIEKTLIVHHLLSSSVQMAYCESGVSNRSISFTKIIYTGVYMILNAYIFIPSPKAVKLQVCKLRGISFRCHFLVCSCAEHVKLEVLSSLWFIALFCLFSYQHCSFVSVSFERLTVAGNWTRCCTQ